MVSLIAEERRLRRVSKDGAGTGMTEGAWLYILRCADGSSYIGTTRSSLDSRIAQHNAGTFEGYTSSRRPVELIFSQWFDQITDAIENERKLKKWSRAKKEAFIRGDFASLQQLQSASHLILRDARLRRAPQDEEKMTAFLTPPPADPLPMASRPRSRAARGA